MQFRILYEHILEFDKTRSNPCKLCVIYQLYYLEFWKKNVCYLKILVAKDKGFDRRLT